MACKPCAAKKAFKAAELAPPVSEYTKLLITCPCGLARALPDGLNVGDNISLSPCPRCGSGLQGTFIGDKVEAR